MVQHKLFQLDGSDIVDLIVALRKFTRSLIIKRRVEDLQLGVESYQKKHNIIEPQKTFPGIEFKELYTPSYKPPGVIYKDLNKQKRVMRADELYKFSNGTLKTIRDELHHRILDFFLGYNKEMSMRKWPAIDKRSLKLIDKQMRERRIIWNPERLVGARELEMNYRLMTHMVPMLWSTTKVGYDKDAEKGIKHWGERRKLCYRSQTNKFSKHNVYSTQKILGNFVDLHLNEIEDMLLLMVQHKLFQLDGSDIVDLIVALRKFTRSFIIKRRVEDLQLGVESYQKKHNIIEPQKTFAGIEFKELYTPSYKPPG
nr:hypothetical protein [Tanacetum cinerariifolium]